MIEALEALVSAAIKAPSGDNLQPWRFELDPAAGRVTLLLDESRDPSLMNAGQRMSRIACGAAIENMLRTAQKHGWEPRVIPSGPPAAFSMELGNAHLEPQDDETLSLRVTNRRVYESIPVPGDVEDYLADETPELNGVRTCWMTQRPVLAAFADLEARAFEHMYGLGAMRRAIVGNVRFDVPAQTAVEVGLSTGSLELNSIQRMLLKALGAAPDGFLRNTGALKAMSRHVRRLARSAAGLCVILAPDLNPETDIWVGRCMQRAWLALTEAGLAAQPMMCTAVLDNVLSSGSEDLRKQMDVDGIASLLNVWPGIVPEARKLRPAFVLRFGYANAPSGRTGRLPAHAVSRIVLPELASAGFSV